MSYQYPEHIDVFAACYCVEVLSNLAILELKMRVATTMSLIKLHAFREPRALREQIFLCDIRGRSFLEAEFRRFALASSDTASGSMRVGWLLFLLVGLASMESSILSATIS